MATNRRSRQARLDRFKASTWIMGASAVVVLLLLVWLWNSKNYPEATSADGLHLIKALYTACSSQSEERLAKVEKEVLTIDRKGMLTQAEREAFESILYNARAGEWHKATAASYQFAQDQVR